MPKRHIYKKLRNGRSNIHSKTYSCSSNPSVKFVERMTGNMAMDGINSNHETSKHEVGEDEMTKMTYNIQNLCNISAGVLYSKLKCIRL